VVARVAGNISLHDIAPDGRLLMAHTDDRTGMTVLAPGDTAERDRSWLDFSSPVDISRDGTTILFVEAGVGGGARGTTYLRGTDGSPAVPVGQGGAQALSPDGQWALLIDAGAIVLVPTGAGEARRIEHPALTYLNARWLPDGRRVVIRAREDNAGPRLYVLDLDDGALAAITPESLVVGPVWASSPDGARVAVASGHGVELYPAGGGQPRAVPGLTRDDLLVSWIDDGLLVSDNPDPLALSRIYRVDPVSGRREIWKEIVPPDPAGVMLVRSLIATPDGRSHVYAQHRALSDLYLVEGLS
jgi:eukaryotic-like serine/threonine-protein kinase